jgi:hypothetical protein
MSSRALRKLQKDQGLAHLAETLAVPSDDTDLQDESDDEPEQVIHSKPAKNIFDLVSLAHAHCFIRAAFFQFYLYHYSWMKATKATPLRKSRRKR